MGDRLILWSEVVAILDHCAPGWTFRITNHNRRTQYGARIYPSLPKGPHKNPSRDFQILANKVRHMLRQLGISDACVAEVHGPRLQGGR